MKRDHSRHVSVTIGMNGRHAIAAHGLIQTSIELVKDIDLKHLALPMKYASYMHACVQTLLVGKHHRHVHKADAQARMHHATISPIQKGAMFHHFANQ